MEKPNFQARQSLAIKVLDLISPVDALEKQEEEEHIDLVINELWKEEHIEIKL